MSSVTPIFLLSLPRSGSTLAQRVLTAHPDIASISEPWLLLPVFSALSKEMCTCQYGHEHQVQAISDLCEALPNGRLDYYQAVRAFADTIYEKLSIETRPRYFLDKTPRYHLIARNLVEAFPDAKFIILWRNPLATLGSRIRSYGGVWRLKNYHIDLYDGLDNLIQTYQENRKKFHVVNYEKMVAQPETVFRDLFSYLEIEYRQEYIQAFTSVNLAGVMGDKTGIQQYDGMTTASVDKWKKTLSSPIRKLWCRQYLHWLGEKRLSIMGYDLADLRNELRLIPNEWAEAPSDIMRLLHSYYTLWRTNRKH